METNKVRCNNCMELFDDDESLMILEEDGEFYKGCPICLTDGYLIDMEEEQDGN